MENKANKKDIPSINGTLRAHSLQIPEVIWKAKGMLVLGRRIKSVLFSTDIAIIRNCNADAVLAVYPFTPQQIKDYTTVGGTPFLDNEYTVFGEVIDGMEVIDRIQQVATDRNDRPKEDVRIVEMIVID